jgi:hypothetical protein
MIKLVLRGSFCHCECTGLPLPLLWGCQSLLFLKYIGNSVKAQGWNEVEDHPVTAGEEARDQVFKPYAKDSKINAVFDFSKMKASAVKYCIQQQQSHCPQKQGTFNSPLGMDKPVGELPGCY